MSASSLPIHDVAGIMETVGSIDGLNQVLLLDLGGSDSFEEPRKIRQVATGRNASTVLSSYKENRKSWKPTFCPNARKFLRMRDLNTGEGLMSVVLLQKIQRKKFPISPQLILLTERSLNLCHHKRRFQAFFQSLFRREFKTTFTENC